MSREESPKIATFIENDFQAERRFSLQIFGLDARRIALPLRLSILLLRWSASGLLLLPFRLNWAWAVIRQVVGALWCQSLRDVLLFSHNWREQKRLRDSRMRETQVGQASWRSTWSLGKCSALSTNSVHNQVTVRVPDSVTPLESRISTPRLLIASKSPCSQFEKLIKIWIFGWFRFRRIFKIYTHGKLSWIKICDSKREKWWPENFLILKFSNLELLNSDL